MRQQKQNPYICLIKYVIDSYQQIQYMKQCHKKTVRDPVIRNLNQLSETISKMHKKNKLKYEKIMQNSPSRELKLFNPSIPQFNTREQISFAEQIMLRQIDRLLEEEEKFNIELDKLELKEEENKHQKQIETRNSMDHFTFLRKSWNSEEQANTSLQHAEKLLHNVGSIKGHIFSMIKKEKQVHSNKELHKIILQSPEYQKLQQQKCYIEQENKKLKEKAEENSIESLRKQMKAMQTQIQQLQKENQQLQKNNSLLDTTKQSETDKETQGKLIKIKSATKDYTIQIKSKQITENKQIYSILTKDEVINYFMNGGRRGSGATNETEKRKSSGINFNVEDIAKSKFISTRAKQ